MEFVYFKKAKYDTQGHEYSQHWINPMLIKTVTQTDGYRVVIHFRGSSLIVDSFDLAEVMAKIQMGLKGKYMNSIYHKEKELKKNE